MLSLFLIRNYKIEYIALTLRISVVSLMLFSIQYFSSSSGILCNAIKANFESHFRPNFLTLSYISLISSYFRFRIK